MRRLVGHIDGVNLADGRVNDHYRVPSGLQLSGHLTPDTDWATGRRTAVILYRTLHEREEKKSDVLQICKLV